MFETIVSILGSLAGSLGLYFIVRSIVSDERQKKIMNENLEKAEKEAFKDIEEELNLKKSFKELKKRLEPLPPLEEGSIHATEAELSPLVSRKEVEEQLIGIIESIEKSSGTIEMKSLFNVNSKRIEKYQVQTRFRARWSFIFAILSMFAGLGFVIWGGTVLLSAEKAIVLAAGGIISAIGGGVGGYITKTFLDVHKLSLNQLNRYFKQPVINDHILMAQRLANESDDPETKKKAYETVINSIAELIKQETDIKKE